MGPVRGCIRGCPGRVFVSIEWLGAEDAGVATWSVGVAFAEWPEEFGEEFVGSLNIEVGVSVLKKVERYHHEEIT